MPPSPPHSPDPWVLLEKYRERYDLASEIPELESLRRSIRRRKTRRSVLHRRLRELTIEIEKAEAQLEAVNSEIAGATRAGALLLEEVLDRVRTNQGEAWSPTPVLGFRAWRLHKGLLYGAKVPWTSPVMSAECLHFIGGEDLPHSEGVCGPPPCGVYAVKEIETLCQLGQPASGSWVIGVVAMTGKVIEHELGYRAAHSTVAAVVGKIDHHRFAVDDQTHLSSLFAKPVTTARELGNTETEIPDDYLSKWKEQHATWIWAKS
jgi:hypothetical protein